MSQNKIYADQLGRKIQINHPPKRIISLVPSQTELLFDLGLNDEVVGVTKFCVHPENKFKSITKIGGTKKLNMEKIRSLNPDLIIGNKEENEKEQIETLMKEFPVWMSDIYNLDDALNMMKALGKLVDKNKKALEMATAIKERFTNLEKGLNGKEPPSAAYLIWKKPNMLAGKQTFIDEMLKYCGLINISSQNRYPEYSDEELRKLNPEVVLLSSEPYPFKEKHTKYFQRLWPNAIVKLVDGEMFSWYGSRLLNAAEYFRNLKLDLKI